MNAHLLQLSSSKFLSCQSGTCWVGFRVEDFAKHLPTLGWAMLSCPFKLTVMVLG